MLNLFYRDFDCALKKEYRKIMEMALYTGCSSGYSFGKEFSTLTLVICHETLSNVKLKLKIFIKKYGGID